MTVPQGKCRRPVASRATALVMGGGSGIGLGTARRLVADGAHVTVCSRTEEKLRAAVEELSAVPGPGSAAYAVANVTVEDQIAAAVDAAAGPEGRLDILSPMPAGPSTSDRWPTPTPSAVRATVDVEPGGDLSVHQARRPAHDRRRWGSIVGMSSGAGGLPPPSAVGLRGLQGRHRPPVPVRRRGARHPRDPREHRPARHHRRRVDGLHHRRRAAARRLRGRDAHRRVGTVEDVAAAVRFLAGPESTWITGDCIAVDGGHHLRRGANYELLFGP